MRTDRDHRITNLASVWVVFLMVLTACVTTTHSSPLPTTQTVMRIGAYKQIVLPNGYGWESPSISVYFTDPTSPFAYEKTDGIEQFLAKSIDSAKVSVDMAIYNLDNYSIQKALIDAYNRGVTVRIVSEQDNKDTYSIIRLQNAGIPIVFDQSTGLMHNKFVIIDGVQVWTGSANFSDNSFFQDRNNMIHITSRDLAMNYEQEFKEMFSQGIFGWAGKIGNPRSIAFVDGTQIETYFSPDDEPAKRIVEILRNSQKSIYFFNYSLTGVDFSDALIQARSRGVIVSGYLDDNLSRSKGSEMTRLIENGIKVGIDDKTGLLHHKVFIIDQQIVILGSYNFSANAEKRNDENILIIHDPSLAELFTLEYQKLEALFPLEQ